jgi:hypothetical protein
MRGTLVLVLGLLVGCGDAAADARVRSEIYRIRDATLAGDGKLVEFSDIQHTGRGVESSWSANTDLDWPAYKADVTKRLAPKYRVTTSTDSELGLSWMGDGDAYGIVIRLVSTEKPRSLRVKFTAAAS